MIKYVYLVDCENVGVNHFIPDSPNESLVYYFISDLNIEIKNKKSYEFFIQRKHTGCKDALDFIIDSYLGFCLNKYGRDVIYGIVSNDKGFENMVEFWGTYGYNIHLYRTNNEIEDDKIQLYLNKCLCGKSKYIKKITNIYRNSWNPKLSQDVLYKQLYRSLHGVVSDNKIKNICNFIYNNFNIL